MNNIINWIKQNKLVTLLLLVVAFLLLRSSSDLRATSDATTAFDGKMMAGVSSLSVPSLRAMNEAAPAPEAQNRLVVSWSNLSLQVKNVAATLTAVKKYAEGLGGYMVDSSQSNPLNVASGDITVRVPSAKLDETLVYLRGLAVQVVSEQLTGTDVTDQYVDTAARLAILAKTKARFEELALKAVNFADIMMANQQILAIQDQIDSLNGAQKFLEKTAEMAKVTVYLSTDEFSLPYAPAEPWRPDVIFKAAVRSLVATGRDLAGALIWLAVYSVVLVPVGIVAVIVIKKVTKKPQGV